MAKVSVIVPVYKVERYLRRCIDSLLVQTFRDFELILVDDGSPDNCGRICDDYAVKDSRVVSLHRCNGGLSAARNTGLDWAFANSDSQYIAFIDSDDWVDARYLETLMHGVSLGAKVSCVCCRRVAEDGEVQKSGQEASECQLMSPKEYWQNIDLYMTAWGKLYDKLLWTEIRFPVGKVHEDEYVAHRLLFASREVAVFRAKLYSYFQRNDSIMQDGNMKRKLDLIGAFSDQIGFFKERGLLDLMNQAKIKLLKIYVFAIKRMEMNEYRENLRDLLRTGDISVLQCPEAYRVLHPVMMLWYWPYLRLVDIVSRRGFAGAVRQLIKSRCCR